MAAHNPELDLDFDEGFEDDWDCCWPEHLIIHACPDCFICLPSALFSHSCCNPENSDDGIDDSVTLRVFASWVLRNQHNPYFNIEYSESQC